MTLGLGQIFDCFLYSPRWSGLKQLSPIQRAYFTINLPSLSNLAGKNRLYRQAPSAAVYCFVAVPLCPHLQEPHPALCCHNALSHVMDTMTWDTQAASMLGMMQWWPAGKAQAQLATPVWNCIGNCGAWHGMLCLGVAKQDQHQP